MKGQIKEILSSKNLVINEHIIRVALASGLSLNEFLVLAYFANDLDSDFSLEEISTFLGIDLNDVMESFNSLMEKGFVSLENVKDDMNRNREVVKLDSVYDLIGESMDSESDSNDDSDLFKTFELELGRTISPMELECINDWLDKGTSPDIILGALREAILNGVSSFRYIDKIIYEWSKKGFKTMDDVNKYLNSRRSTSNKSKDTLNKEQQILDYDWLDND